MNKSRLEAFSDSLFAVAMTIMVLEMQAPTGVSLKSLVPVLPVLLSYVLSFLYVAVYWVNHHLLLAATCRINNKVLWANIGFLFWITLIPFFTSWVDENHVSPWPVVMYGMILMVSLISYRILEIVLYKTDHENRLIRKYLKEGRREKVSLVLYIVSILMSVVHPYISFVMYFVIAFLWVIPNRDLSRAIGTESACRTSSKQSSDD